jgi:hypothetical protein
VNLTSSRTELKVEIEIRSPWWARWLGLAVGTVSPDAGCDVLLRLSRWRIKGEHRWRRLPSLGEL